MKANELSIGDWVCAKMTVINGEERLTPPMRVVAIGDTWVQLRIDPDAGDPDEYDIEDIRPITLTAEILVVNGFSVLSDTPYYTHLRFEANTYKEGVFVRLYKKTREIDIDYNPLAAPESTLNFVNHVGLSVHELQHALRLAGIEKEIKL